MNIDLSKLAEPFDRDDIEWRVSRAGRSNGKVFCKDNSMKYRAVSDSQWSLFWEQFEEETGKEVKYKDVPFTCSC